MVIDFLFFSEFSIGLVMCNNSNVTLGTDEESYLFLGTEEAL